MNAKIKVEQAGAVTIISVLRPETLNALNREVIGEIDAAVTELSCDNKTKALIFYSEKNFAAGADIKAMVNCSPKEACDFVFNPTYNKIAKLPIPTIAAIDGFALGGGMELACACDFRIASCKAQMGFPEITLGIMPGAGGTIRLPRIVGESAAKELIFFGKRIDAKEAYRIGLVNLVTEPELLISTAMQWAEKLSKRPRCAMQHAKQSIENSALIPNSMEAIEKEAELWSELFATNDQKEGMTAFLEKRKPVYQDC